jgi:hypothetical protein
LSWAIGIVEGGKTRKPDRLLQNLRFQAHLYVLLRSGGRWNADSVGWMQRDQLPCRALNLPQSVSKSQRRDWLVIVPRHEDHGKRGITTHAFHDPHSPGR